MRKIASLVAVAMMSGGLSMALAAPAQAEVTAKPSLFCRDLGKIGSPGSGLDPGTSPAAAATTAKALRKASKHANHKVKKALNTMAGLFQRVADGDRPETVEAEAGTKFISAITVFSTFYLKHCVNITVPTSPG